MRRLVLAWMGAMVVVAGCKGSGGGRDAGPDAPDAEVDPDATVDPGLDPVTEVIDTAWDPVDIDEEEVAAVCGDREVGPGEDCDPPGTPTTCRTRCGTRGTGECTSECRAPEPADCTPPAEACNLVDDDCDGLVDEGVAGGWAGVVTLAAGGAAWAPAMDLAWADDAYAAAWVVEGSPDAFHMAIVDEVGRTVLADTAVGLSAGEVVGRPALAWTGSDLLLAWTGADASIHVAVIDRTATVVAHDSTGGTGLAPSPDVSWSGSHAALAWIGQAGSSQEVHLGFLDGGGALAGSPVVVTSGAVPSQVAVDAGASAVAVVWADARSGPSEIHRAVYGHDGAVAAADAALTSTGGASRPGVAADHRIVAWTDDHDGTARIYTLAMDTSWAAGGASALADAAAPVMGSSLLHLGVAAGAELHALGADGLAAGGPIGLALDAAHALVWGDLAAAAAGASGTDLVLARAGCAEHEACNDWTPLVEPLETRTGFDPYALVLGHEAALEGSWSARPVTYLSMQIFQDGPYYGPDSPGTQILTGAPYETCGVCVLVYEGCAASTCARTYLARSGTLAIESIGGQGDVFAGTLTDAILDEVTIESTTRTSTWVEGGRRLCLGRYLFSGSID